MTTARKVVFRLPYHQKRSLMVLCAQNSISVQSLYESMTRTLLSTVEKRDNTLPKRLQALANDIARGRAS